MDYSKLKLLNLPEDAEDELILEHIEKQIFDIKRDFLQPGFAFKKYYSKHNKLKNLSQLMEEEEFVTPTFEWDPFKNNIHEDYPSFYNQKNQWNLIFQQETSPQVLLTMIEGYEEQLLDFANSWVNSFDLEALEENNELYDETKLNMLGDPGMIYKSLSNINEEQLKDYAIFRKFVKESSGKTLLKELIKASKFLKAIDGKSRR